MSIIARATPHLGEKVIGENVKPLLIKLKREVKTNGIPDLSLIIGRSTTALTGIIGEGIHQAERIADLPLHGQLAHIDITRYLIGSLRWGLRVLRGSEVDEALLGIPDIQVDLN